MQCMEKKEERSINILKMRLGAFSRPFEQGRRRHQNFRKAFMMKMSPFYPTDISSFSVLCIAQPKLPVCFPLHDACLLI